MKIQFGISAIIGALSTLGMSILMYILTIIGFPEMNPPKMMAMIMNQSLSIGWVIHFFIGITFTMIFNFLLFWKLKAKSLLMQSLIFGIMALLLAQVGFGIIGAITNMPAPKSGNMTLIVIGSILTHLFFGFSVAVGFKLNTKYNHEN